MSDLGSDSDMSNTPRLVAGSVASVPSAERSYVAEFVVLLAPKFFGCDVTALSKKATKVPEKL